mmetsp:Transcript_5596/g.15059  ORF Transcript_5596/g.15059 Transcript_5596/m.15059 type:complete len:261 (-) Transcript_5596:646-1428(-)
MARQGSIPLDKYQRVRAPREDAGAKAENEVRIMGGGRVRTYIQYALELLNEKGFSNVEFAAMGRAINMAVLCAEILKRRVHGLHQITELASLALVDVWEPKEEGLETIRVTRNASAIRIKLSMAPLDTTHPGYQAPLPADQVQPIQEDELDEMDATERTRRPGRGRGRGGRGRGRGRGGRGGGRGSGGQGANAGSGLPEHLGDGTVQASGGAGGGSGAEGGGGGRRGRSRRGRRTGRGRGRGGGRGGNAASGGEGAPPAQ